MAELQNEQAIIVNAGTGEFFGKIKEVKNNEEYEISFFDNKSCCWASKISSEKNSLVGQQCRVYYLNKERIRSFFTATISSANGNFILQQSSSAGSQVRQIRHFARFKVDLPATVMNENLLGRGVIINDVLPGVGINVKTFNISTGGVGIISEIPFQLNSFITIEVNFCGEKVKAIGEVKYCLKNDALFFAGVEFIVISEETKGRLENLLLVLGA
ncbi:MAG: PilZ domain-containing protein [Candidatus Ratteibacteria bacterium]|jgi:hypothetical protein